MFTRVTQCIRGVLDPPVSVFSLSLYRHPFLYTLFSSRFTLIININFRVQSLIIPAPTFMCSLTVKKSSSRWHIVSVSRQGATPDRHTWRQDRHYHSWPHPHTSTFFRTQYSLTWFWPWWGSTPSWGDGPLQSVVLDFKYFRSWFDRGCLGDTWTSAATVWSAPVLLIFWWNWHLCFCV